MSLCVVCRTNAPWETMTEESFLRQIHTVNLNYSIDDKALALVRLWSEATGLDYFLYRGALQLACREALRSTGLTTYPSIDDFLATAHDDDIVIMIDDDDIIYPDVGKIESLFHTDTNIVTWDRWTWVNGAERTEGVRGVIDTCNSAIRWSFIRSFPDWRIMLDKHQRMHAELIRYYGLSPMISNVLNLDLFKQRPPCYQSLAGMPGVIDVHALYSLYHIHTASISWLGYRIPPDDRGRDSVMALIRQAPLHPMFNQSISIYEQLKRGHNEKARNVRLSEMQC